MDPGSPKLPNVVLAVWEVGKAYFSTSSNLPFPNFDLNNNKFSFAEVLLEGTGLTRFVSSTDSSPGSENGFQRSKEKLSLSKINEQPSDGTEFCADLQETLLFRFTTDPSVISEHETSFTVFQH